MIYFKPVEFFGGQDSEKLYIGGLVIQFVHILVQLFEDIDRE